MSKKTPAADVQGLGPSARRVSMPWWQGATLIEIAVEGYNSAEATEIMLQLREPPKWPFVPSASPRDLN